MHVQFLHDDVYLYLETLVTGFSPDTDILRPGERSRRRVRTTTKGQISISFTTGVSFNTI